MTIPKGVLDQALRVYADETYNLLSNFNSQVSAERKTLTGGYKNADKTFEAKVDAIEKERKSRKKDAVRTYKRDSTSEGSSYTDFAADKQAIDTECDTQVRSAEAARDRTYFQLDTTFADRLKVVLDKNAKAVTTSLRKLSDALPSEED